MTNILLSIIILLLLARIGLQIAEARRAVGKSCATADEVQNIDIVVKEDDVSETIVDYGRSGFEFVCAYPLRYDRARLFFTRKIKKTTTNESYQSLHPR